MKKIVREVKIIEELVSYQAIDGRVFTNEEDCARWEKSYECTIKNSLKNIPQIKTNSEFTYIIVPPEEDVLVLKPRNIEDINVINAYIHIIDESAKQFLTQDDIGKGIMLETGYDEDYICVYRMKEYLEHIIENYKKMEKDLDEAMENSNS